jgi:hypothetical protein
MHDPVFCKPLYELVTEVKTMVEEDDYQQAFALVDGLLLALSGEVTNGMDRWTYMESAI